jgi:hypothetical protein
MSGEVEAGFILERNIGHWFTIHRFDSREELLKALVDHANRHPGWRLRAVYVHAEYEPPVASSSKKGEMT